MCKHLPTSVQEVKIFTVGYALSVDANLPIDSLTCYFHQVSRHYGEAPPQMLKCILKVKEPHIVLKTQPRSHTSNTPTTRNPQI